MKAYKSVYSATAFTWFLLRGVFGVSTRERPLAFGWRFTTDHRTVLHWKIAWQSQLRSNSIYRAALVQNLKLQCECSNGGCCSNICLLSLLAFLRGLLSATETTGVWEPLSCLHALQRDAAGHQCDQSFWRAATLHQRKWWQSGPQPKSLFPQHCSQPVRIRRTSPVFFRSSRCHWVWCISAGSK